MSGTNATKSGFNEAPIHESGKYLIHGTGLYIHMCFNEAPIHESGKFLNWQCAHAIVIGFNEAPIHESGKFRTYGNRAECQARASMRPRFMNRGSANARPLISSRSLKLQ